MSGITPAQREVSGITPAQREMLDLGQKTQAWIDDLIISGMDESAAVCTVHLALVERVLARGGVGPTIAWLRGTIEQLEITGPALLAALRAQGH